MTRENIGWYEKIILFKNLKMNPKFYFNRTNLLMMKKKKEGNKR